MPLVNTSSPALPCPAALTPDEAEVMELSSPTNAASSTQNEVSEWSERYPCNRLSKGQIRVHSSTAAENGGSEGPTERLIWDASLKSEDTEGDCEDESGGTHETRSRSEKDTDTTTDSEYELENGWWSRWDDDTTGTVSESSPPDSLASRSLHCIPSHVEFGGEGSATTEDNSVSIDPSTLCSSPVEQTSNPSYGDPSHSKDPETAPLLSLMSHTTPSRAVLTILEFISTEHSYLSSLRMLLIPGATLTPPPPLMVLYTKGLVRASEDFLWAVDGCVREMEEVGEADGYESEDTGEDGEVSVRVVAGAFLRVKDKITVAMVRWCGVVGSFFVGPADDRKGTLPGRRLSKRQAVINEGIQQSPTSPKKANVWSLRLGSPTGWSPTEAAATSHISRRVKKEECDYKTDLYDLRTKMGVRDLAILPTQRVMRYVLMFKGQSLGFSLRTTVTNLHAVYADNARRPPQSNATRFSLVYTLGTGIGGCSSYCTEM